MTRIDADLHKLLEVWSTLPPRVRQAILTLAVTRVVATRIRDRRETVLPCRRVQPSVQHSATVNCSGVAADLSGAKTRRGQNDLSRHIRGFRCAGIGDSQCGRQREPRDAL